MVRRKRRTPWNGWTQTEFLEILKQNDLNLTRTAAACGFTIQNAIKLSKRLGIKISKQVILSEPQQKRTFRP
jgi:hypothetical protein